MTGVWWLSPTPFFLVRLTSEGNLMAKVVHLETVVSTVFGIVDEDDNVVDSFVVGGGKDKPIQVKVLNEANWSKLYHDIMDAKSQVTAKLNAPAEPDVGEPIVGELVD